MSNNLFSEFPEISSTEWMDKIVKDLKGAPLESLNWSPEEGIDLKPFYREEDIESSSQHKSEFVHNDWLITEFHELGDGVTAAKHLNSSLLDALELGVQAIVVGLDRKVELKELNQLFRNVNPAYINTFLSGAYIERNPGKCISILHEEFQRKNVPCSELNGGILLDPIGYFVETGEHYSALEADLESVLSAFNKVRRTFPNFSLLDISLRFLTEMGSTATREIAVALGIASEYLNFFSEAGVKPEEIASRMQFTFSATNDYFLTISKIRAFRNTWQLLLEGYGLPPFQPVVHCTTRTSEESNPYRAMIASTTQSMAAVLGGSNLLTIIPSEQKFDKRLARNIQHILKEESHFNKLSDPCAGSYYLEVMTEKIGEKSWKKFKTIEQAGGLLSFISP